LIKNTQIFGRKLLPSSGETTIFSCLHTLKGNKIYFTFFPIPKLRIGNQDSYIAYYKEICLHRPKKTYYCSNSNLVLQASSYAIFPVISLRKEFWSFRLLKVPWNDQISLFGESAKKKEFKLYSGYTTQDFSAVSNTAYKFTFSNNRGCYSSLWIMLVFGIRSRSPLWVRETVFPYPYIRP
jgi:hypothetical protein